MPRRFVKPGLLRILPTQSIGGDQLGDGEVADNDDADASQHQRGVEHARRERGAVTQLGEVVVIPIRIVRGKSGDAYARHHEERQQRGDGFGIHQFRLHEGNVTYDACNAGAEHRQIAVKRTCAHDAVDDGKHHE